MLRRKRFVLPIALALCVGAAVGLAAVLRTPEVTRDLVRAATSYRVPSETAVDWVGFADQFVVARVVSERQLLTPTDEKEMAARGGEGSIEREVTVQIEAVVWQRPGALAAPSSVTLVVDGWWVHDNRPIPMASNSARRVEVGDRVLTSLVRTPEGPWSALSAETMVLLTPSGVVASGAGWETPAELRGKNIEEVAALLSGTSPDAIAAKNQGRDIDARAKAVWDEQLKAGAATG